MLKRLNTQNTPEHPTTPSVRQRERERERDKILLRCVCVH